MRVPLPLALFALALVSPAVAQSVCSQKQVKQDADSVASLRNQLRKQAVRANDPVVPAVIGAELLQLKDALEATTRASLACSPAAVSPEQLQGKLAAFLQANLPVGDESEAESDGKRDQGSYGADLAVQVFELFSKPRIFEVDFRYGMECGDDHLLLVFTAADAQANDGWHEQMRWDAPHYRTVADAFGDFVLLTPLTGNPEQPQWHYLVAHGHPGCGATPRTSRFDLELLTPGPTLAKPSVDWHFEHAYNQGDTVPRLATTEDTIDLRITPAQGAGSPETGSTQAAPGVQEYKFRRMADGRVVPVPSASAPGATTSSAAQSSATPR